MEITISEPIAEKVIDSCMGVDNRRYYKVQWQATWEPEDEMVVKYQHLVEDFWKDTEAGGIEAGRTFINTLFEKLNQAEESNSDKKPIETEGTTPDDTVATTDEAVQYHMEAFYKEANSPEHKISDEPPPAEETGKPPPLWPYSNRGKSEIRPFKCDECIRSYPNEKKLKEHKRKLHTNLGTYQCSMCPKVFTTKRNLQNHMNRHTGVGPHQCPGCNKRFMTPQEVNVHKRSCNNLVEKEFQCDVCSKRFATKTHLAFHTKIHLPDDEKPFKCQYCPRTFAYNHDCVHHMRLHVGEKPFKCEQCDAAFHRKSYLTEHMFLHTGISKYRCVECLEYFKTQQMLQTHVKNVHILKKPALTEEERQRKNKKHKKKKPIRYKCEECGKEFKYMKEYHYHQVVNHKEAVRKKTENVEFMEFEPTMVYKCKKCEKTFTWPSALKKHAETHRFEDLVGKYIEVTDVTEEQNTRKQKPTESADSNENNDEEMCDKDETHDGDSTDQHIVVLYTDEQVETEGEFTVAPDDEGEDEGEPFTCGYCYTTYDNEVSLNVHMLEKHQNRELTEEKPTDEPSARVVEDDDNLEEKIQEEESEGHDGTEDISDHSNVEQLLVMQVAQQGHVQYIEQI